MTEQTREGYDTVEKTVAGWRAVVPVPNPSVLGCYGNGLFANHTVAKLAFPHALIFTYDVHASDPSCDAVDCEKGDATVAQLPGWNRQWPRFRHVLPRPTDYTFASQVSAMITALLDAGFKREDFNVHSAHFGRKHICGPGQCEYPQADGTQWLDKGPQGQNVDQNVFFEHFFTNPRPKHDPHYGWFDTKKRRMFAGRSEVETVKAYDRLRATQSTDHHPNKGKLYLLRAQLLGGGLRLSHMKNLAPYHRQWRKRQLLDRAHGHRFV